MLFIRRNRGPSAKSRISNWRCWVRWSAYILHDRGTICHSILVEPTSQHLRISQFRSRHLWTVTHVRPWSRYETTNRLSFVKCRVRGLGVGRFKTNSGGSGNTLIFSQCAGSVFVISKSITVSQTRPRTYRLLIQESNLTAVANR
jgi:hypothetical protein